MSIGGQMFFLTIQFIVKLVMFLSQGLILLQQDALELHLSMFRAFYWVETSTFLNTQTILMVTF